MHPILSDLRNQAGSGPGYYLDGRPPENTRYCRLKKKKQQQLLYSQSVSPSKPVVSKLWVMIVKSV